MKLNDMENAKYISANSAVYRLKLETRYELGMRNNPALAYTYTYTYSVNKLPPRATHFLYVIAILYRGVPNALLTIYIIYAFTDTVTGYSSLASRCPLSHLTSHPFIPLIIERLLTHYLSLAYLRFTDHVLHVLLRVRMHRMNRGNCQEHTSFVAHGVAPCRSPRRQNETSDEERDYALPRNASNEPLGAVLNCRVTVR